MANELITIDITSSGQTMDTRLSDVENALSALGNDFVKRDGTTPFTELQRGVTPDATSPGSTLTTISYINNAISNLNVDGGTY